MARHSGEETREEGTGMKINLPLAIVLMWHKINDIKCFTFDVKLF